MGKLIVTEFVTLDGVMEDPTSWQRGYSSQAIGQFKRDELFGSDALLLGRVTYEEFAGYWPSAVGTGEFGERMNRLPKYVASRTLKSTQWNGSTLLEGDAADALRGLKQQDERTILVYGSGNLVQTLLRQDLIDELRLMVYPLILGAGQRLFPGGIELGMRLLGARGLGAGVQLLTYQPARQEAVR